MLGAMSKALSGRELVRRYGETDIIRGVSMDIGASESVALLGPSGCGKTTLLQILGLLDRPDGGAVHVDGTDAWRLSARARARLRARTIGFVFQRHNLLHHLSPRDNVALAGWHAGMSRKQARARAEELLGDFGLGERLSAKSRVLSPGEAQRVAIARALINQPRVILADEPTGSLDSAAAAAVLDALSEVCAAGSALLVVTHNREVAARWDRQVTMKDGRLVEGPAAEIVT